MPGRGFPPSNRSSACASTVFPAPVSPVITFRPGSSRSSARSISRRFSTRSSRSMRRVVASAPDGKARTGVRFTEASQNRGERVASVGQPSELLPEAVVEGGAGDLREQHLVVRERDVQRRTRLQLADGAAVGRYPHLVVV